MDRTLVIGIAGGSGSGKTTLMKNIIAQFGDVVTVISHDNYYKQRDDLSYEERCAVNYDEPDAFAAGEDYFPEGLDNPHFYQPVPRGLEIKIGQKLAHLQQLNAQAANKRKT